MTEQRISIYEGMFLFPQSAGSDLGGAVSHVESILERADAELVAISKWDERRLAYDIKGNKRGLYVLTYFKADRSKIAGIERDCNLSEMLLRAMIVRAEHIPTEEIEAADGRQALEDEIKLRAERGTDADRPMVAAISLEEEAAQNAAAAAAAKTDEAPKPEAEAETETEAAPAAEAGEETTTDA